jgi:pimeloyl-ACP methyl ester carboxylesterase
LPAYAEIKTSVASRDGTQIAYWTSGSGRPLVLVHGASADHRRWRPLLPYLEPYLTVHALDRRGRGTTGDAPGVPPEAGGSGRRRCGGYRGSGGRQLVSVYVHSHGGIVASGAAAMITLHPVDPNTHAGAPGHWLDRYVGHDPGVRIRSALPSTRGPNVLASLPDPGSPLLPA